MTIILLAGAYLYSVNAPTPSSTEISEPPVQIDDSGIPNVVGITPIEHATMVLTWRDEVIYTDPVGGSEAFKDRPAPTIIVVTDIHPDHLDPETLQSVVSAETALLVPQAVADQLPDQLKSQATVMVNGDDLAVNGFSVTAVPMYNLPESTDSRHVKGRGNGYLLERDEVRLYIAGDTGGTPEMLALTDIDIAFIPMNPPFTMSPEEAAEAVLAFGPKRVYPYHYRTPDGLSDVEAFKTQVTEANPAIDVVLLDWYPETSTATDE